MPQTPITTLFLDVGGVLLTNGWDRRTRQKAAEQFGIDYPTMDERHHLSFSAYEDGRLTLDQYLMQTVFYEPRSFTPEDFKAFMYAQSQPYPEMIDLFCDLKARLKLRIAVVSNECRELTTYRVSTYKLADFVDAFIVSCFVHFRKPEEDIYRLALDVMQVRPEQVVYVDDRPLFIEIARGLGITSIEHHDKPTTQAALTKMGLS